MDKLLCTLGMGIIVGFIKMKTWVEGLTEMVRGVDGFILMLGICAAGLAVVSVMMLFLGRRKTA